MAVKLRLRRMGKKKAPFYRIVAIDSRSSRDGKYIEKVGHYDPTQYPEELVISEEKAIDWLKKGATPSETLKNLLSKKGILLKFDLLKKGLDDNKIDEEIKKWELLQLERVKRKEAEEIQSKSQKQKPEEDVKEEAKSEEVPGEDHVEDKAESSESNSDN